MKSVKATIALVRYKRKPGFYIRGYVNAPMTKAASRLFMQDLLGLVKRTVKGGNDC